MVQENKRYHKVEDKHYQLSDFDYDLPHELIAQTPLKERDASRLLVLNSETGEMQDKHFYDILDYFKPGDALVMNDTRVMPARLYGVKPETGAIWKCYCLTTRLVMIGKP